MGLISGRGRSIPEHSQSQLDLERRIDWCGHRQLSRVVQKMATSHDGEARLEGRALENESSTEVEIGQVM
jgi:hypothetical protein